MASKQRNTEDLILRMPNALILVIDKRRKETDSLPSRQEIIRRILMDHFAKELAELEKDAS